MVIQSDLIGDYELNFSAWLFRLGCVSMRSREIENYKKTLKLTREQRDTLVGILLGDACLETQNDGRTYRLKVEQSADHQAYVEHLYEVFEPWVLSEPRQREKTASTGGKSSSWGFSTLSHGAFRFYAQQFYCERKKCVPKSIRRWLTPRGLAYWYMDDGSAKSSQSKGVIFNTQGFPANDVDRLIGVLGDEFELDSKRRRQSEGWQIYVSGHSFETFRDLVEPFMIDAMRYKLPHPRRTQMPKE